MTRRVEACVESHGGQFEHFSLSSIPRILNVPGHMLVCGTPKVCPHVSVNAVYFTVMCLCA
jgi:hypothetical protein